MSAIQEDSPTKKDILFIINSMERGGAERATSILSNELARRGWKVHIALWGANIVGYELAPEVDVIDISDTKPFLGFLNHKCFKIHRFIPNIRKVIKHVNPDVTIAMMSTACIFTWLAVKWLGGIKFISSERIDPTKYNFVRLFLSKRAYAASSACVLQTKRVRDFFSDKVANNSVVIHNPVNVKISASPVKRKRIVSVGRLVPQKNHELLINSFAEIHRLYPEYKLDIYGEGYIRNSLQDQINSLGLEDFVRLCGNVPDVHERIKDAEIFVMSSDYEGMSNALIEAMVMGLACISTDVAGADEVINNEENGLIIPVGDCEKLTQAITRLIDDRALAKKFGDEAKKCAKKFSVRKIVDEWEELIIRVINN